MCRYSYICSLFTNIFNNNCTGSNHNILANCNIILYSGANSNVYAITNFYCSTKCSTWRDMDIITYPAIVFNN